MSNTILVNTCRLFRPQSRPA